MPSKILTEINITSLLVCLKNKMGNVHFNATTYSPDAVDFARASFDLHCNWDADVAGADDPSLHSNKTWSDAGNWMYQSPHDPHCYRIRWQNFRRFSYSYYCLLLAENKPIHWLEPILKRFFPQLILYFNEWKCMFFDQNLQN